MAALDSLLGNETLKESLSAALCGRAAFIVSCFVAGRHRRGLCRALPGRGLPFTQTAAPPPLRFGGSKPGIPAAGGRRRFRGYPRGPCARGAAGDIQHRALRWGRAVHIKGADKLNGASANALLKVLEEPPEGVCCLS